jgi:hypothetical protein
MSNNAVFDGIPSGELPLEEVSARGVEWYGKLPCEIETANRNRYVAIDVVSGDLEIARSTAEAMRSLQARRPGAQMFLRKIGSEPEPELESRVFGGSISDWR